MSHLTDPNTKRLATRCIMCGLALRDAKSVEIGIGPICRDKHGYGDDKITEAKRKKCNVLIHKAGLAVESDKDTAHDVVFDCADKIEKIGLKALAAKIRERFIGITLEYVADAPLFRWDPRARTESQVAGETRDTLRLKAPYSPQFNRLRRHYIPGQHRPVKADGVFYWELDKSAARGALELLSIVFPGQRAHGSKGMFRVPTHDEFATEYGGKTEPPRDDNRNGNGYGGRRRRRW